ncbi:hypothetical protein CBGD1_1314 [Sulfurimonas gotlandica GD1]|nr:hypothetical protein CBGD1_1314 [Sulfurimonas gotlandica GD1]
MLLNNAEGVINNLGNCIDSVFDKKKTKMNVIGSILGVGTSLTKLAFNATGCAIKNTPKAVVTVAAIKRKIVNTAAEGYNEYQKQQKKDALDAKILQLKFKA